MKFIAKSRDLRIVKKPTDRIIDEQRRVIPIRGETIEFSNYQYVTNNPETIQWLFDHRSYGIEFVSDEPTKTDKQKPKIETWDTDDVIKEERKKEEERVRAVQMIQGAKGTFNKIEDAPVQQPQGLTEEKVIQLIAEKTQSLENKLDQLLAVLTPPSKPEIEGFTPPPKPKKEFHCPICGIQCKSGVEIGKHKKESHPKNK